MDQAELEQLVEEHERWCQTNGRDGACFDVSGRDLAGADLYYCFLGEARFDGADLSRANCLKATLDGASLVGAKLCEADLRRTSFASADLRDADLTGALFLKTAFFGADLRGATIVGPFDALYLDQARLAGARLVSTTAVREDLDWIDVGCANEDRLEGEAAVAWLRANVVRV